jgi:threonine aldolase
MQPMTPTWMFASDNTAGVHPEVMAAIAKANTGCTESYGADPLMERLQARLKEEFGESSSSFLVFNGTAANVMALQTLTRTHHAVLCTELAHIHVDECGAPERIAGCKLYPIPVHNGKLTPSILEPFLESRGDQHRVQMKVISISQMSEVGTVYTAPEVRALADFAHANGLYLHMDGARIANAAASLGLSLKQITTQCGVDALSFGGTKNGAMGVEAVVFMNESVAEDALYIRKQGTQLASKMRFLAAQMDALLTDDLWLRNARHANAMALLLADEATKVPGVEIPRAPQGNAVFARMPPAAIPKLQATHGFYVWDAKTHMVRWMTSFATQPADVTGFVSALRAAVA